MNEQKRYEVDKRIVIRAARIGETVRVMKLGRLWTFPIEYEIFVVTPEMKTAEAMSHNPRGLK